jgi:hypothetical protein
MLVPHLQTYLADHRAGIAALCGSCTGTPSDGLWLSMYGPPMTDNGIYDRVVARTREGLGQPINPYVGPPREMAMTTRHFRARTATRGDRLGNADGSSFG